MAKLSTLNRTLTTVAVCATALVGQPAQAQTWIDWNGILRNPAGAPVGATGTITLPTGVVNVNYTGDLTQWQLHNDGTNHWSPSTSFGAPDIIAPTNSGIMGLQNTSTGNTLTFSSPLDQVFFAVWSVGRAGDPVSYTFDRAFSIVDQGPSVEYGCGSPCLAQSGNTLTGREGNGVVLFNGPVSSISFDVAPAEFWHGFTIGAAVTTTPEPASMTLLATGLAGIFGVAIRRKRKG